MTPIAVFVYCRYEHTKRLFESLYQNKEIADTDVYIFSDAAKSETKNADVARVREYIHKIAEEKKFHSVKISENKCNKGLARSIIDGVTEVLREYDSVIVLEDDLIVSNDYLRYMNEALKYYRNDPQIGAVTGFSYKLKSLRKYKKDIYIARTGNCWGWGTWKGIWNQVDWEVVDYERFRNDKVSRMKFDTIQHGISTMLDSQMEGKIDSWAVRWDYHFWKNSLLTVYPTKSRIRHEGYDEGATHCTAESSKAFSNDSFGMEKEEYILEPVEINEKIASELAAHTKRTFAKWIVKWRRKLFT